MNRNRKKRKARGQKKIIEAVRSENAELKEQNLQQEMQQRGLTTRNYGLRATSIDEKARTVEAVIATEDRVTVMDWQRYAPIEEILRMDGCILPENRQVPMFDTHMRWGTSSVMGSTRNIRIEGDKLIGTNHFSGRAASEDAWTLVREGHLTDNSIGYRVRGYETIQPGESKTVKGRSYKASPSCALRVATEWEVIENSICPIGADRTAKNRAETPQDAGSDRSTKNPERNFAQEQEMNFDEWVRSLGLDPEKLTEERRAEFKGLYEARGEAGQTPAKSEQRAAAETEVKTQPEAGGTRTATTPALTAEDIKAAALDAVRTASAELDEIRALGSDLGVPEETVNKLINDKRSLADANKVFLEHVRSNRPAVGGAPAIIIGDNSVSAQRFEDAMLLRAGMEDVVVNGSEDGAKRAEQASRMRGVSLIDLCRFSMQQAGMSVPFGNDSIVRAALQLDQRNAANGMLYEGSRNFASYSLSTMLGNIANKSLLRGYSLVDQTWRKWCTIGNVSDFKEVTRNRFTLKDGFKEVGNGGKIGQTTAGEEAEKYSIATYGQRFSITRTDIINDDLGQFTRVPSQMGRHAGLLAGRLVYGILTGNPVMGDGTALFQNTKHKNLRAGSAFNEDNVAAAITYFRGQTDKADKRILVKPVFLLIPAELEFVAKKLLNSSLVVVAGSTDTVRGDKNVLQNALEIVTEDILSENSTTSWYITGSPNDIDTVEVAYLNGKQEPTIERFDMPPDVLGIQFRAYLDLGAKAIDWRGMQKNTA